METIKEHRFDDDVFVVLQMGLESNMSALRDPRNMMNVFMLLVVQSKGVRNEKKRERDGEIERE